MSTVSRRTIASRACDACKRRKVRCDAGHPCANCRIALLSCEYTVAPRKRGRLVEKRPLGVDDETLGAPPMLLPNGTVCGAELARESRRHDRPRDIISSANSYNEVRRRGSQQTSYPPAGPGFDLGSPVSAGSSVLAGSPAWDIGHIQTELVTLLNGVLYPATIEVAIHNCIDVFAQYLFPNAPIAHEPALRAGASLFRPESRLSDADIASIPDVPSRIAHVRTITLVTALCACVTSVMPDSLIPRRSLLCSPFLRASRAMLKVYDEYDLDHPDSSSLTIRIWHSIALRNAAGKTGAAWHCHGEAALLAQRLRLFDERSVSREAPVESQLLRANFWLLCIADNSAVVFGNRPVVLHELLCGGELTLLDRGDHDWPLLDPTRKMNQGPFEDRIFEGFHLKRRVWSSAAALLQDIKSYIRHNKMTSVTSSNDGHESAGCAQLTESYLRFVGIVDNLAPWLRYPHTGVDAIDDEVATYQRTCFWAQRSSIMTSFHCLQLVILQSCIENNVPAVMGLNDLTLSWAMKKVDIVQDFLYELQLAPVVCFKAQEEAAVERIHTVGHTLVELVHSTDNNLIKARAKSQFAQLLVTLAKLDSRASDQLGSLM